MSETDIQKVTEAATSVMNALQSLSPEDRSRVLHASAALFGIAIGDVSQTTGDRVDKPEASEKNPAAAGHGATGKRQSIVEFLNDRQAATNDQRIACFAHYREHVEGKGQHFSKSDLESYFGTAKLSKPGNYDRDFRKAVQAGWIHEEGANSYLTQGGEDAVKAGFGGKGKPRGAAAKKRKSATDKAQ
jgi:hypothetical protein